MDNIEALGAAIHRALRDHGETVIDEQGRTVRVTDWRYVEFPPYPVPGPGYWQWELPIADPDTGEILR